MPERRRYKRYSHPGRIVFRTGTSLESAGETLNFGAGGALVHTTVMPEKGVALSVSFTIPGGFGTFVTTGRVLRTEEDRLAIEFLEEPAGLKEALKSLESTLVGQTVRMRTELEGQAGVTILRIKGDLRLWNQPEAEERLAAAFRSGLESSPEQFVLNLSELTHIDTRGIALLVKALVKCYRRHMGLKVVLPTGVAAEAIRRTRIFDAWPKVRDEAEALV